MTLQQVNETLNEREKTYGDFNQLAAAIQALKSVFRASPAYARMTAVQREAMEMVILKQCRVIYGDPLYFDSWRDLAGYAMLAVEEFHPRDGGEPAMKAAAQPKTPLEIVQLLQAAAE